MLNNSIVWDLPEENSWMYLYIITGMIVWLEDAPKSINRYIRIDKGLVIGNVVGRGSRIKFY